MGDAVKAGVIGGVVGGLSTGAANKVGNFFGDVGKFNSQKELARSLAHGSIGGLASWAQGAKFKHGFFAGAFASMAGSGMEASKWDMFQTTVGGTVSAAVVGGTASTLGGGKFANGAVTGAYTMLYNHIAHRPEDPPEDYSEAESENNSWISDIWNNSAIGKLIPDVIYVNQSGILNYVGGGGYTTGYAFVIKGKDAGHLYSTLTLNLKAGMHGAFGVNAGYASYIGDSRNFDFDVSFGGNGTRGFDSDIIIGIGGSVSPLDHNGGTLHSYDIGIGPSIGASINIGSYTYVSRIW